MKKMKYCWFMLSLILVTISFPALALSNETWMISMREFPMQKGERIIGFAVKIKSGSIFSLPKVPMVWAISIKNFLNDEPPWNTSLEALAGVGAAALDREYFKDFLVIEKHSGKYAEELRIQVKISTSVDFGKERERIFTMQDLILKPIKSDNRHLK